MSSLESPRKLIKALFTREFWALMRAYVGLGGSGKSERIENVESLSRFIETRANHVSQTSLYGYLRTRAGTRFPLLFDNPDLLVSINYAKWHVTLACISDLSVFVGQSIYRGGGGDRDHVGRLMSAAVDAILARIGDPGEAGADFPAARERLRRRIELCDWSVERDDDTVFSQSPEALVHWAPIAEELKERDETIVRNSIRFRWIEIRRAVRNQLDPGALVACGGR